MKKECEREMYSEGSSTDQIDLLVNDLEKRVIEECEKLKKEANPKAQMQNHIRQIAWKEPELAAYLRKRMSQILNFNDCPGLIYLLLDQTS